MTSCLNLTFITQNKAWSAYLEQSLEICFSAQVIKRCLRSCQIMHHLILIFQGPLTPHVFLTHLFLRLEKTCQFWVQLRLGCLLVLNWFWGLSMPFLEGFVLSTQTDPQTALEPVVESGTTGVAFVCVIFFFFLLSVFVILVSCQREHYFIPGHSTVCTPRCVHLWICIWAEPMLL